MWFLNGKIIWLHKVNDSMRSPTQKIVIFSDLSDQLSRPSFWHSCSLVFQAVKWLKRNHGTAVDSFRRIHFLFHFVGVKIVMTEGHLFISQLWVFWNDSAIVLVQGNDIDVLAAESLIKVYFPLMWNQTRRSAFFKMDQYVDLSGTDWRSWLHD